MTLYTRYDFSVPSVIVYSRHVHAAHLEDGRVRDCERWDVEQPFEAPQPSSVPPDARKHSGSVRAGVEYTTFVRWAPATDKPNCPLCTGTP